MARSDFNLSYLFRFVAVAAFVFALINGSGLIFVALFAVLAYPVLIVCFAAHLALDWMRSRQKPSE